MRSILIPTMLLVFSIVLLSLLYSSFGNEIVEYDEKTGKAIQGEDFWQDFVTGNAAVDDAEQQDIETAMPKKDTKNESTTKETTQSPIKPSGCGCKGG